MAATHALEKVIGNASSIHWERLVHAFWRVLSHEEQTALKEWTTESARRHHNPIMHCIIEAAGYVNTTFDLMQVILFLGKVGYKFQLLSLDDRINTMRDVLLNACIGEQLPIKNIALILCGVYKPFRWACPLAPRFFDTALQREAHGACDECGDVGLTLKEWRNASEEDTREWVQGPMREARECLLQRCQ